MNIEKNNKQQDIATSEGTNIISSEIKKTRKKIELNIANIDKELVPAKFKELENNFLLVKIGSNEYPAKKEDIQEIQDKLTKIFAENSVNCIAFVTHHLVDMQIIKKEK